uniref:Gamma-glutamylcyclotransferase AIG2-like domain-containing protein n=1 Tax=Clytia hemisphaerica TaxID=252671 RepID=A0A7M5UX57_9CNID|eukprot:TCONS_00029443-protein
MASNIIQYFDYGTNMNPEKMSLCQIPFSERRPAKLENYEFVMNHRRMNGTAGVNIRYNKDSTVYGILYTCTYESIERLDRYMGSTYSRQLINVIPRKCSDPNTPILVQDYVDEPVSAHIYIGLENSASNDISNTVIDISKEYLEHVLCGRDMLPKEYVDFLTTFQQHTVTVCPGEEYFLIDAANETEE